jgi:hypothetical protein
MKLSICSVLVIGLLTFSSFNINPTYKMAKLKYAGGGDWYGDRTALPNLIKFCNENLKTNFQAEDEVVEVGSAELFNYPFVFMTGHGNVIFSDQEVRNLRKYLTGGGFLHIDDNYGLDKFIRPQIISLSTSKNLTSLQACLKYMSMMISTRKDLA